MPTATRTLHRRRPKTTILSRDGKGSLGDVWRLFVAFGEGKRNGFWLTAAKPPEPSSYFSGELCGRTERRSGWKMNRRSRLAKILAGRIGGLGPAKRIADEAAARGVTFVNHTFTSRLALSASLQPYAGLADHRICEYPAAPKQLALDITQDHLPPDANGEIAAPDAPGLGMAVNGEALSRYRREVEIRVDGKAIFG